MAVLSSCSVANPYSAVTTLQTARTPLHHGMGRGTLVSTRITRTLVSVDFRNLVFFSSATVRSMYVLYMHCMSGHRSTSGEHRYVHARAVFIRWRSRYAKIYDLFCDSNTPTERPVVRI
uniref:Uncharacterized protein n=1 Tax=Sipha flava TaxID=143950 RepID=A0A2S2QFQ2_9HEMI